MTHLPLVFIVILNWNGWRDSLLCVESCRKLSWPNFRILVVDNASNDGSEEFLRKNLVNVEIIQSGANLGFAGGNNVGIRHALSEGADYVWLLNNDAVVEPQALTTLVEAMENDLCAGIASSKIYFHDDPQRLSFVSGLWEKGRLRLRLLGANQLDYGQYDEQCQIGSASGCSMLVSTRTIQDIGLMYESYFLYWEDTEWCVRAQQKGYTIIYVPKSCVWHKVSASTGKDSFAQQYYFIRNGFFFLKCHGPIWLPAFVLNNFLFGMKCLFLGDLKPMQGLIHGFLDFIKGRMGPFVRDV